MAGVKMEQFKTEEEDTDIKPAFITETWSNVEFINDDIKKDINEVDAECMQDNVVDIKEEPVEIIVYKNDPANCQTCHYNLEDGVSNLISNHSAIATKNLAKTLPKNFFNIKGNNVVYASRCIPENILFGPYIGLESLRNNTGYIWILKGGRQAEADSKHIYNWMRYIQFSDGNQSECNLSVFQSNGFLYYRTNRNIICGEQLLAQLDDRLVKNFANDTGKYYCPTELDDDDDAVPHIYACFACCLGFNSEIYLQQHLHRRNCLTRSSSNAQAVSVDIVQCPLCKMVSFNKQDIKYHLRNNCTNKKRIASSNRTHPVVNPNKSDKRGDDDTQLLYRCTVCDAVFKYKTNLKRHTNTHENGKQFHCHQCDYKSDRKSNLRSHIMAKHTGEYACHSCDFIAKRKTELKLHKISAAHSAANINKQMTTETDVIGGRDGGEIRVNATHISNSNDDDDDDDDESNSSNVIVPSSSGSGLQKYKCSMCNQELTERATLRRHIKAVHAREKPYRCDHCDYKCASTGSLYKHLKIHTGEKPHVCHVCNWRFVEKCKLKRHMKVHTRDRYPCAHCGHQARTIATLNKHMKRVHNIHVNEYK